MLEEYMVERYTICIVDDDETILEFLKTAVESFGYKTITASTATEALTKIKKSEEVVAISLVDIMMPGINGVEFIKRINKEFPDIICISMTGYPTIDAAIEALNAGAFAYIIKPVNLNELKIVLKNATELYELRKSKKEEKVTFERVYIVLSYNENGIIIKTNKALAKLLGYNEKELIGKDISLIFPEEYIKSYLKRLYEEEDVRDFPMWLKTKQKNLSFKFSGVVIKNTEGKPIGLIGTIKISS
jgi:PAS domain S-box-containing protein